MYSERTRHPKLVLSFRNSGHCPVPCDAPTHVVLVGADESNSTSLPIDPSHILSMSLVFLFLPFTATFNDLMTVGVLFLATSVILALGHAASSIYSVLQSLWFATTYGIELLPELRHSGATLHPAGTKPEPEVESYKHGCSDWSRSAFSQLARRATRQAHSQ